MSQVIEQTQESAQESAHVFFFGDAITAFAKRNGITGDASEAFAVAKAKKIAAAKAMHTNAANRLHKIGQKAAHTKDGYVIDTTLTYRATATEAERELCERFLERSKAQSERHLAKLTGDLAKLE